MLPHPPPNLPLEGGGVDNLSLYGIVWRIEFLIRKEQFVISQAETHALKLLLRSLLELRHMKLETLAVHAGYSPEPTTKAVAVPI